MQTWLADDFLNIFADDFGQSVIINHVIAEDVNAITGVKTKYNATYTTVGVLGSIKDLDVKVYPNISKSSDFAVYIKTVDIVVSKGDTIIISEENFIVIEKHTIQNVSKIFCRKC